MKKILLICFLLVVFKMMIGQKSANQIEINPYANMNWYPEFEYAINPVNSNTVTIRGISWGVNIGYKFPVKNNFIIKAGLGYYKYSFNKIDQVNSLFRKHDDNRIIDGYRVRGPITPGIIFSTSRYFYNTILLNTGIEKQFNLHKNLEIIGGLGVSNYYTFSQLYHVLYPDPTGDNFKTMEHRYFGVSVDLTVALQKQFRKMNIGPMFILPVYSNWRQDEIFPQEEDNKMRKKWSRGFGVGISCNYILPNKKQQAHIKD